MAIAWSQRAFSFILIEGIYSWATESVVCLHTHCSGQICLDCCWRERVAPWLWKLQHTGVLAEVIGCNSSICSLEKDLLGVCRSPCECCLAWVTVFDPNHLIPPWFSMEDVISRPWMHALLCRVILPDSNANMADKCAGSFHRLGKCRSNKRRNVKQESMLQR